MKRFVCSAAMILGALVFTTTGCKSTHEEDVKSNLRKQWTEVAANTEKTTEAAKEVLAGEELKDVVAKSTAVDGTATGKMADGTKVEVTIKKKSDNISHVSVVVGSLGSPTLGADIAKKIKVKAERQ
jgi:hypothetical protein